MVPHLGKHSLCVLHSSSTNNNSDSRCSGKTSEVSRRKRKERLSTHRTDEELSVAVQEKTALVLHAFPVLCNVYLQFFQGKGRV